MTSERCLGCGRYRDELLENKPCENGDGNTGCHLTEVDCMGRPIESPRAKHHVTDFKVGDKVLGRYTWRVGVITAIVPAGFHVSWNGEQPSCYHPELHLLATDGSDIVGGIPGLYDNEGKRL